MLDVKQINVSYGNIHAVRDVSLNVERGEIVTIIGANGAGKSTILKTLVGLLRSTTGDILFEGKSISTLAPAAIVSHGIALVPEGRRIFPRLSTLDNLSLGGYGHSKRERTEGLSRGLRNVSSFGGTQIANGGHALRRGATDARYRTSIDESTASPASR